MLRNQIITPNLIGKKILVHNGKSLCEFNISSNMVNFKIGEFCATKKKIIHKQKK